MNRQLGALIVLLGVVAVVYLGVRYYNNLHRAAKDAEQKEAFEADLVANEVVCDACGAVSKLDVEFRDRYTYQKCPKCGEVKARPIVYRFCQNPACNKRLVRFINDVWVGSEYFQSPHTPVCPVCGESRYILPETLHLSDAKRIARETGQPFPPEE
jgi:ribosomal protein L32